MENKTGVYICRCGAQIACNIDCAEAAREAGALPGVAIARDSGDLCSASGLDLIKADITHKGLTGVAVFACTPCLQEGALRRAVREAGLKAGVCRLISEHRYWPWWHEEKKKATRKFSELIESTLSGKPGSPPGELLPAGSGPDGSHSHGSHSGGSHKPGSHTGGRHQPGSHQPGSHSGGGQGTGSHSREAGQAGPSTTGSLNTSARSPARDPNTSLVVVGAGITGLRAALEAAEAGRRVYLVEKEPFTGGHVARLDRLFPTLEPADRVLEPLTERVINHPGIRLFCPAEVIQFSGRAGDFTLTIKKRRLAAAPGHTGGEVQQLQAGAVILATGFQQFDPGQVYPLGYGRYSNILTGLEFEALCRPDGLTGGKIRLANGDTPDSVALLHCVGGRDKKYNRLYCSRVCCLSALKYAFTLREKLPAATVYELYIDMRCAGSGYEEFYERAQHEEVNFIRGRAAEIVPGGDIPAEKGRLVISLEDTLLRRPRRLPVDLVVLSCGLEPCPDAGPVAGLFGLRLREDGFFLEQHPQMDTVTTATEGVFLAGCCQSPKDIRDSLMQASAAVARALVLTSPVSSTAEKEW